MSPKGAEGMANSVDPDQTAPLGAVFRVMSPKDAEGMANSVDPDQTAPLGAVWSGSALFAQTWLSENLGSLQYQDYGICLLMSMNLIYLLLKL